MISAQQRPQLDRRGRAYKPRRGPFSNNRTTEGGHYNVVTREESATNVGDVSKGAATV